MIISNGTEHHSVTELFDALTAAEKLEYAKALGWEGFETYTEEAFYKTDVGALIKARSEAVEKVVAEEVAKTTEYTQQVMADREKRISELLKLEA